MRRRDIAAHLPVLLFAAVVLTQARPAFAQSCGGAAGTCLAGGAAAEGTWLERGQAIARLSEEYEVKDRSYKGAHGVPNDFSESLFVSRSTLDVRYGVSDDWTAELTATYPHFTYRLKPPGGERTTQRFRGPGDTIVWAGRRIGLGASDDAAESPLVPLLSLWAGASLPTGSAERPNPAFVTRDASVSNLQTGTGTFDPLLRARAEWPQSKWTPFVEADVRYPFYENRYRYRTGDAEAVAAGASAPITTTLSADLALTFQRDGRDRFRGDDVGVGGARRLFLGPGLTWRFADAVALDVGFRTPIYRRTQTKLSDSTIVWQVGLTFRF